MTYTDYEKLPLVLSVKELAALLHISKNTAYELARSRRIRCVQIGRQYRIPKESIKEFLNL